MLHGTGGEPDRPQHAWGQGRPYYSYGNGGEGGALTCHYESRQDLMPSNLFSD
jgi:hypothetical protein